MGIYEIILLAVALAMDCLTVSMVSGVIVRQRLWGTMLRMALLFSGFQALMPLIGWVGIRLFSQWIEAVDHWIAFGLLVVIGGKMLMEAFEQEEEHTFNPRKLTIQLLLAVATSIDALAVGISMGCTGYHSISQLTIPLVIIGAVSFLFSITGYLVGIRFGRQVTKRIKPEIIGGIILILIGVKILWTHLME
ncbi:MAG: manganese efflux pump [Prevotella sp.]|nr:manganese efflux pump [Prevotella sp.]